MLDDADVVMDGRIDILDDMVGHDGMVFLRLDETFAALLGSGNFYFSLLLF